MRRHTRASSESTRKVFPFMCLLVGLSLIFFCSSQVLADERGDNFDDNIRDVDKWGKDEVKGGSLNETGGHLEYTCSAVSRSSSDRPWILRQFPTTADWEISIDVTNNTLSSGNQLSSFFSSFGINVRHIVGASNKENGNEIEVELAAFKDYFYGLTGTEFLAEFYNNGIYKGDAVLGLGPSDISAPIRIAFNSTDKIFTVSYDTNPGGTPQWYDFGTFGVGPSGGGYYNADWGLNDADKFVAYVFGYAEKMGVGDGKLYGDNFKEDGGVPWGGPAPEPKGSFRFAFPADNPLLIRILNITGNYSGLFFTLKPRNYAMDVAQDESGKLSIMGTMDGAKNKDGGSEISGAGTITTVNGKPTGKLKGNFAGTFDDLPTTAGITASGPVEVTNIGNGTDGFMGTYSSKGKYGGVPFKGSRETFDAPEGTTENFKKVWTLQLDITSSQDAKGKSYLVASAQIELPNGETIVFPEKKTKYSAAKGYSLSFKGGTNTRTNLPDKKTSISIKGMTMTLQQDGSWQANAGTITYQFLGQKGSGNLLDFIAP
jgi:hypothetical protein